MDGESPIADTESIYPDTSSMTDLAQLGRSIHGLKLRNSHSDYTVSPPTNNQPIDVGSVSSLPEAVGGYVRCVPPEAEFRSVVFLNPPLESTDSALT